MSFSGLRSRFSGPCMPCSTSGRTRLTSTYAKKDGRNKGSNKVSSLAGLLKKKQEAEEAQAAMPAQAAGARATPAQYADAEVKALLFSLANSYFKATKTPLVEVDLSVIADAVWAAPFVCLAHDKFQAGVTDPKFIYANRAALELWDASWDQLIGMPSRLSASEDPETQKDRQALLDKAAQNKAGFVGGYEGWRVGLSGKRFKILDCSLFNITDFAGEKIGQAAVFKEYQLEDGTVVQVTSEPWLPPEAVLPPSEDELKAAEAAVEEQAELVRSLKAQGLTNQDPTVQGAVVELKARKAVAEDLKKRIQEALVAAEAAFDDE